MDAWAEHPKFRPATNAFLFAPNVFFARINTLKGSGGRVWACAQSHTKEPSFPLPSTAENVPGTCRGTTIYYNIPSVPDHLAEAPPLSHPLDGDAYVLALSFPLSDEGQIWVRGRFARTKAFLVESRARKRIYRGIYGTPGMRGWNAPLKPRASCLNGIMYWGDQRKPKVLLMGPYTLPLAIDGGNLVSKGPTALGDVLTDSQELVRERGTELSCSPVRYGNTAVILSLGRTSAGSFTGAFVVEKGRTTKRYPRFNIPKGAWFTGITASGNYIVTAMCVTKTASANFLSSLIGKSTKSEPPKIDLKAGSLLTVLARYGTIRGTIQINGIIVSHLMKVFEANGELTIRGLCLSSNETQPLISLQIVSDAFSGTLWNSENNVGLRSDVFEATISINDLNGKKRKTMSKENLTFPFFEQDVMLVEPGSFPNLKMDDGQCVCTAYDVLTGRAGLKAFDNDPSSQRTWFTSGGDDKLSGAIMSQDGSHIAVLRTRYGKQSAAGELLVFDTSTIENGPVTIIELENENFGQLRSAVGGVWAPYSMEWSEDGSKPVKSAYEIFDSRGWNDIDSSFSSLGLNQ